MGAPRFPPGLGQKAPRPPEICTPLILILAPDSSGMEESHLLFRHPSLDLATQAFDIPLSIQEPRLLVYVHAPSPGERGGNVW